MTGSGNASRLLFGHVQFYYVYSIIRRSMEQNLNLVGWILFAVCAGFFIISAIKASVIWHLIGSIVFLGGSAFFVIPFIRRR